MANFIVRIIVGGSMGWLASIVMHTDDQQGTLLNIIVGVVGALIAGLVLTPIAGMSTISQNTLSMAALLVPLLGAISLLAVVSILRRGIRQQR